MRRGGPERELVESETSSDLPRPSHTLGVVLASTVSQVGCVTTIIVIGALLLGLWLDNLLDTRPTLTVALTLISIPISLFSVVRIATAAMARVRPASDRSANEGAVNDASTEERRSD
jgi:F0F1-type ATP synthase assembly protein I